MYSISTETHKTLLLYIIVYDCDLIFHINANCLAYSLEENSLIPPQDIHKASLKIIYTYQSIRSIYL